MWWQPGTRNGKGGVKRAWREKEEYKRGRKGMGGWEKGKGGVITVIFTLDVPNTNACPATPLSL